MAVVAADLKSTFAAPVCELDLGTVAVLDLAVVADSQTQLQADCERTRPYLVGDSAHHSLSLILCQRCFLVCCIHSHLEYHLLHNPRS